MRNWSQQIASTFQPRSSLEWWGVTDLNRGPSRCKRDALTAELTAQFCFIVTDAGRSVNAAERAPGTATTNAGDSPPCSRGRGANWLGHSEFRRCLDSK